MQKHLITLTACLLLCAAASAENASPAKPNIIFTREWAYVQLGGHWFVREQGWKMNQAGELFDMSDAPFVEKPVIASDDTDMSQAARARLTAVLTELNPAAGKTDTAKAAGGGGKAGKKKKKGEQNK